MSAFLFLLIPLLGILTVKGAALFKVSQQQKLDAERIAYEVTFPNDLRAERIIAFLRAISAVTTPRFRLTGVMSTAYELHATQTSIRAFIRVPAALEGSIIRQLGHIPGLTAVRLEEPLDYKLDYAVEIGMNNPSKPLEIKDISDVSTSILKSLEGLGPKEYVVIQLIVSPVPRNGLVTQGALTDVWHWTNLVHAPRTASNDELNARRKKVEEPNFRGVLRVGARSGSNDPEKKLSGAKRLVARVRDPIAATGGNHNKWVPKDRSIKNITRDIRAAHSIPVGGYVQLAAHELAALIAWRLDGVQIAGMSSGGTRPMIVSSGVPVDGRVIGVGTHPNTKRRVAVSSIESCKHFHIVGRTGSGKTALMANLAAQDIAAGAGMVVIDPKGELVDAVINYVPHTRLDDVVVFDVNDSTRPVGFNMLSQGSPQTTAFEIQSIFDHIYKTTGQVTMPEALYHLVIALMTTSAGNGKLTFLEIMTLIAPKTREDTMLARAIVDGIPDPYIKGWFHDQKKKSANEQLKQYASLRGRIWQFMSRPEVRNVIGQSESSIDLHDIVKNKKILLVNLKGLPEDVAALIGSLIVNNLWHVAKAGYTSEEDPFSLYLDEFQHFVHSPISAETLLAEGRSFGLRMHLAHQGLDQLAGRKQVEDGVMNNAVSKIVFQRGRKDASTFAQEFGSPVTDDDLKKLRRFEFIARVAAEDGISPPFTGMTLPPFEPFNYGKEARRRSRLRYGRDLVEVDEAIKRRRQIAGKPEDSLAEIGEEDYDG